VSASSVNPRSTIKDVMVLKTNGWQVVIVGGALVAERIELVD